LCCGVDQAVNAMLPAAMRSDRAGSLFKQMCVESTGTASFTFFAPCGQASNLTAFHQETKKRRSWNCGCGDFIVQPLSTAASVRSTALPLNCPTSQLPYLSTALPLNCPTSQLLYLSTALPLNCVQSQPHHDIQLHAHP